MNIKKLSLALLTILALAACNQGGSGTSTSSDVAANSNSADPIVVKIGFSAPLNGPQAHYGKEYLNGVQMAIVEANAEGIKFNDQPVSFELLAEDDGADPKTATQVAEIFVDKKVSGVIGHFNSGTAIPASRVYEDAGIPNIAMATSPVFTDQGFKTVFRSLTSDTQAGGVLGEYVVKNMGLKNIAIIDDRTAYGQGLANEFEKSVKAADGNVLPRQFTNDKATDFQSILTAVKAENPDIVFYGGADTQSAPMAKQMKRLGFTVPLISGEMTKTPTFLQVAGLEAEGILASLAGLPLEKMPKGKDYEAKYKERYKEDVATYSPYGYDSTKAMITAMKEANSSNPADYLPKLKAINIQGVTSDSITFDKKGDLKNISITIYKVENGKWVPVESVSGGGA